MNSCPAIMRRRAAPALAALAALAAFASGCGSDSEPVATVGSEKISVADFRAAAAQQWTRFPHPPDSARSAMLDRMVQEALLVEAARRSPEMQDSLVRQHREGVERRVLTEALVQNLMPKAIPVSDAELRRLYALRDSSSHVLLAYAPDRATADAIMAALGRGEDFSAVSSQYSMPGSVPPGGDAGWIVPGTMIEDLDDLVSSAPVGKDVGPVQILNQGWFVARVVGRRHLEQAPFETESARLQSTLQQRKQRTVWMRTLRRLAEGYAIASDPDGITLMFRHFNRPPQHLAEGEVPADPQPTPEELKTVLATWDGGPGFRGTYTLDEALRDLDSGDGERPNPSQLPALDQWVRNRIIDRIALIEARRRKLDMDPDNQRRIRQSMNEYLAAGIVQSEIVDRAQPTEADLRREFEANIAAFSELASARVQFMNVPDSSVAQRFAGHLAGVPSLSEAVMASSPGLQVREENVSFPAADPAWGILEGRVLDAADGTILPPYRTVDGWRIVQIVSRQMRTPSFEELPFEAQQMIEQRVTERLRTQRLEAVTDSLRKVIPVTMFRDRLRRIAWPPRDAMMPAPTGMTRPG